MPGQRPEGAPWGDGALYVGAGGGSTDVNTRAHWWICRLKAWELEAICSQLKIIAQHGACCALSDHTRELPGLSSPVSAPEGWTLTRLCSETGFVKPSSVVPLEPRGRRPAFRQGADSHSAHINGESVLLAPAQQLHLAVLPGGPAHPGPPSLCDTHLPGPDFRPRRPAPGGGSTGWGAKGLPGPRPNGPAWGSSWRGSTALTPHGHAFAVLRNVQNAQTQMPGTCWCVV